MTTQPLRSDESNPIQSALVIRAGPDARKSAILAAIRTTGLIPRQAALSCSVPPSTFYWWLAEDPRFAEDVEQAEATFERRMAAVAVRSASQGSWQSALHVLERRFPERWGARARVDVHVGGLEREDALSELYQTPEAIEGAIEELHRAVLANMPDGDLEALLTARKERPG